ncbi:ATP-dependent endonuclease [Empedobacter brevis NBRC 14943 = ATCC 43319]|uniref:ATP-dependent endonuclease n=1 Tax=Empedobacter brevis NBRC 14943 = ATCC 43319 TaxID=1218108 RepID=A0A511NGR2_9FLAO|nr:AAA family ATPase [Empedobacter brevis]GEM51836.1 ATP-dependent endonuclease [Empedobacter brevis NBRC 14943 = ATCC 43319]
MKISKLSITNFRLLDDIEINIEDDITLIVGKNNSGKTSLFEIINLFFNDKNRISFHDFSLNSHEAFNDCYIKYSEELLEIVDDEQKEEIEKKLIEEIPRITLGVQIEYDKIKDSLINLSEFISDLDENRSDATLFFKYEPKDTIGIFKSFDSRPKKEVQLIEWLNENISSHYAIRVFGGENLIDDNIFSKIQSIINFETIQASRKLDDMKMDNNRSLALGFSDYYKTVSSDNNNDVEELKITLAGTSKDLDKRYAKVLDTILTKLSSFGVDKDINIPEIILKSKFDPETIIKNNIKYFYKSGSIELPENYNGLGYSNLIYLVLKIVSFIEDFKKKKANNITQILTILIEEPEAHLHPQMQQVFIEQIRETIAHTLSHDKIQVQVMISTHSSHMVAEAGLNINRSFERIRYFSKYLNEGKSIVEVKDFNEFKHKETVPDTFRFLKQYLNLNKCDLFFADKVIMVEGITEKLLMPLFIKKIVPQLENEYVSIIEVGGAYTHKFQEFFKFLNTKVLIVTDIDSVDPANSRKACKVDTPNSVTSNSTLKSWIPNKESIKDLLEATVEAKMDSDIIRVAYQISEDSHNYTSRSLEESIINCNKDFFSQTKDEKTVKEFFSLLVGKNLESEPYDLAPTSKKKTEFSFDLMTFEESETLKWNVPKYVKEGLEWLAKNDHLKTEITE